MNNIFYVVGDATTPPQDKRPSVIAHVCNDKGGWGKGFVMALSRKWTQPENEYKRIPPKERKVGFVHFIPVESNIFVANMVAQNGYGRNQYGVPAINYGALEITLQKTFSFAKTMQASVHMPRIGCGLAGGDWEVVELIIKRVLRDFPTMEVFVYDLQ